MRVNAPMCDPGLQPISLPILHIILEALVAEVTLFGPNIPKERVPPGRLLVWQAIGALVPSFNLVVIPLAIPFRLEKAGWTLVSKDVLTLQQLSKKLVIPPLPKL